MPKLQETISWCQTQIQRANAQRVIFTEYVKIEAPKAWDQTRTFVVANQEGIKKGGLGFGAIFIAWRIYKY